MKVIRYRDPRDFVAETFDILCDREAQNNLLMSIPYEADAEKAADWLMASVKDDAGSVHLAVLCTPPFNVLLGSPGGRWNTSAGEALSRELRASGMDIPGATGDSEVAEGFCALHFGAGNYRLHRTMNIMVLTELAEITPAPGRNRLLRESDMYFAPYWIKQFGLEAAAIQVYDIPEAQRQALSRIERKTHYIWEDDGIPVSQAIHRRSTPNAAVVSEVYTPPFFRGRGYGTSCVADLTARLLLGEGFEFCALMADEANPVSSSIYRKIGYRDVGYVREYVSAGR